jgi:hypothetical protein
MSFASDEFIVFKQWQHVHIQTGFLANLFFNPNPIVRCAFGPSPMQTVIIMLSAAGKMRNGNRELRQAKNRPMAAKTILPSQWLDSQ